MVLFSTLHCTASIRRPPKTRSGFSLIKHSEFCWSRRWDTCCHLSSGSRSWLSLAFRFHFFSVAISKVHSGRSFNSHCWHGGVCAKLTKKISENLFPSAQRRVHGAIYCENRFQLRLFQLSAWSDSLKARDCGVERARENYHMKRGRL